MISKFGKQLKKTPQMLRSISNALTYETMQLSKVMSGSKGRDKICALLQYSVDLYVQCMKYSEVYQDLVDLKKV